MRKEKKKNNNILFIIIVVILIFILSIFAFFKLSSKKNQYENIVSDISDINEAYEVKSCTNKFYIFCKEYIDSSPNSVFEMLDDEYIKKYNLTKNNFKKMLDIYDSDSIQIDKVYKIQEREKVALYIVQSTQLYKNNDITKEFNIVLKVDRNNNTFSVFLDNYIDDNNYNNLKLGDKVNISLKSIEAKSNNTYDTSDRRTTDNVEDIFKEYTNNCIFYEKRAYSLIDEQCKKNKYSNFELFDRYVTDNIIDIVTMDLLSYEETQKDGYIEYKCTSNKGQVYIFKVTSYITYSVTIE